MALEVQPSGIPDELKAIKAWLCWTETESGKKEARDLQGRLVRWRSEPDSLLTFEAAYRNYADKKNGYDGIGFVLQGKYGIFGIDIDDKHDFSLIKDATYTEVSPSGKGLRAFGLLEGVDVSRHPKDVGLFTDKRWLSVTGCSTGIVSHLADCSDTLSHLLRTLGTKGNGKVVDSTSQVAAFDPIKLSELMRNNPRFGKMWRFELMGEYDSLSELDGALVWHVVKAGWPKNEAVGLLLEFRRRAQLEGYDTKDKEVRLDYAIQTVEKVSEKLKSQVEDIPYLTLEQALDIPPTEWLVDGIIPEASLGLLWGKWSTGKTFIMLDIALRMICGMPWFGDRNIVPGDVLYVLSEGEGSLGDRLRAWFRRHKTARTKHNIAIWTHAPQLASASDVRDFPLFIKRRIPKCKLVVIDTLSRSLVGQDENSSMVMSRVVDSLTDVVKSTGVSLVLVHHGTKPGAEIASTARGSSALLGAVDYSIESRQVYPAGAIRRPVALKGIFELFPDKPPKGGTAFEPFPVFLRRSGMGVVIDTNPVLTDWLKHRRKMVHGISADQFVMLLEYHKMGKSPATIEKFMQKAGHGMGRVLIEQLLAEMFPGTPVGTT